MKPHDIEAELIVLGTMIINPSFSLKAVEILRADDFFKREHRRLYSVLTNLLNSETTLNEVSVKEALEKRGYGDSALVELIGQAIEYAVDSEDKFISACNRVKSKSVLRKLLGVSEFILESAKEAPDVDRILDQAEKMLFKIAEEKLSGSVFHIDEILPEVIDRVMKNASRREMTTGIPTGFSELDAKLSGLQPSDLIIVAARPSMGKTAFALSIAYNVAVSFGKSVAIFSLEMPKEQLVMRFLSQESKISLQAIRSGHLNQIEINNLVEAAKKMESAPIYIDDTPAVSVLEVRAKARRLKAERGLDLIIIDYLQLMKGLKATESRQQEVAEISRSLKELAKELDIPVLALSQLSRQVEHRSDKRPQLADLRESGSIEQDADVVMFIHRPEVYKKDPSPEEKGLAEIIIAKQRNGPIGSVRLRFYSNIVRFENYSEVIERETDYEQEDNLSIEDIAMHMKDFQNIKFNDINF